ncbi:hypothetical protein RchiOBHm_Chr2g0106011 [Rosa chinensis]|uniref:Uncharacterized protein n=1 Tax=Rosa chinensis TaxID=74649 RepID=A0A2P6RNK3_ROSCH|nr:hypothetical protein RchiOBHm_Chr2g0106011 [Rosa chinensis]
MRCAGAAGVGHRENSETAVYGSKRRIFFFFFGIGIGEAAGTGEGSKYLRGSRYREAGIFLGFEPRKRSEYRRPLDQEVVEIFFFFFLGVNDRVPRAGREVPLEILVFPSVLGERELVPGRKHFLIDQIEPWNQRVPEALFLFVAEHTWKRVGSARPRRVLRCVAVGFDPGRLSVES